MTIMITADNGPALAAAMQMFCARADSKRITFQVEPAQLLARPICRSAAEVPMITSHGDADSLWQLLSAFDHWGAKIIIGAYYRSGFFEFWIEPDA